MPSSEEWCNIRNPIKSYWSKWKYSCWLYQSDNSRVFVGKLNDYTKDNVVSGTSSFDVFVSSAFEGISFFGRPTTVLTEEDCLREATSSNSVGVIIGCVCGAVALFAIVTAVVWFTKFKSKNESVEMENTSRTSTYEQRETSNIWQWCFSMFFLDASRQCLWWILKSLGKDFSLLFRIKQLYF